MPYELDALFFLHYFISSFITGVDHRVIDYQFQLHLLSVCQQTQQEHQSHISQPEKHDHPQLWSSLRAVPQILPLFLVSEWVNPPAALLRYCLSLYFGLSKKCWFHQQQVAPILRALHQVISRCLQARRRSAEGSTLFHRMMADVMKDVAEGKCRI